MCVCVYACECARALTDWLRSAGNTVSVVWCGVVCDVVCVWSVWCYIMWCGVVWCGVVWCGVCGVMWCGVVWCGVVWYGVVYVV